jgi:hypothetical protein
MGVFTYIYNWRTWQRLDRIFDTTSFTLHIFCHANLTPEIKLGAHVEAGEPWDNSRLCRRITCHHHQKLRVRARGRKFDYRLRRPCIMWLLLSNTIYRVFGFCTNHTLESEILAGLILTVCYSEIIRLQKILWVEYFGASCLALGRDSVRLINT